MVQANTLAMWQECNYHNIAHPFWGSANQGQGSVTQRCRRGTFPRSLTSVWHSHAPSTGHSCHTSVFFYCWMDMHQICPPSHPGAMVGQLSQREVSPHKLGFQVFRSINNIIFTSEVKVHSGGLSSLGDKWWLHNEFGNPNRLPLQPCQGCPFQRGYLCRMDKFGPVSMYIFPAIKVKMSSNMLCCSVMS